MSAGSSGISGNSSGTITNSYSTGSVTGTGSDNVGGLLGRSESGTITESYAHSTGSVK